MHRMVTCRFRSVPAHRVPFPHHAATAYNSSRKGTAVAAPYGAAGRPLARRIACGASLPGASIHRPGCKRRLASEIGRLATCCAASHPRASRTTDRSRSPRLSRFQLIGLAPRCPIVEFPVFSIPGYQPPVLDAQTSVFNYHFSASNSPTPGSPGPSLFNFLTLGRPVAGLLCLPRFLFDRRVKPDACSAPN